MEINSLEKFLDKKNIAAVRNKRMEREKICVLFIEDDEATQTLLRMTAASLQPTYDLIVAENSKDGLKSYFGHAPDITFLDIQLPDGSGLDILKVIKKHDPNSYVVMLTANATSINVKKATVFGADGFIAKPFTKNSMKQIFGKYTRNDEVYNTDLIDRNVVQSISFNDSEMEAMIYKSFLDKSQAYINNIREPDSADVYEKALLNMKKLAINVGANKLANICSLAKENPVDINILNGIYNTTIDKIQSIVDSLGVEE